MKINEVIRTKRLELKLTQEQIAEKLGVSTPAVNKWESGVSYPDITLLPPLARLLDVDLNTLLSFNDNLSDKEIYDFVNSVATRIYTDDFDVVFNESFEKIREYPNCEKLALNIAPVLNMRIMTLNLADKKQYQEKIDDIFKRCAKSSDPDIKHQAVTMLVGKCIEKKDFEQADEYIESLPDIGMNKTYLKGSLLIAKGEYEKAFEHYEAKIFQFATDLQSMLGILSDISIRNNDTDNSLKYIEISKSLTEPLELLGFNVDYLFLNHYIKIKDKNGAIDCLQNIFESMSKTIDFSEKFLYRHIKTKKEGTTDLIAFVISDMIENDPENELEFIKQDERFKEVAKKFKSVLEKSKK